MVPWCDRVGAKVLGGWGKWCQLPTMRALLGLRRGKVGEGTVGATPSIWGSSTTLFTVSCAAILFPLFLYSSSTTSNSGSKSSSSSSSSSTTTTTAIPAAALPPPYQKVGRQLQLSTRVRKKAVWCSLVRTLVGRPGPRQEFLSRG